MERIRSSFARSTKSITHSLRRQIQVTWVMFSAHTSTWHRLVVFCWESVIIIIVIIIRKLLESTLKERHFVYCKFKVRVKNHAALMNCREYSAHSDGHCGISKVFDSFRLPAETSSTSRVQLTRVSDPWGLKSLAERSNFIWRISASRSESVR